MYIGATMKPYLLLFIPLAWLACKNRSAAPTSATARDSTVLYDTAYLPFNQDSIRIAGSIERAHVLDSFHAVKPLAVFRWEGDHDPFYKMIQPVVDTQLLVRMLIPFSGTTIYKYNKEQMPLSCRHVYKSKGLVVEVRNPDFERYSRPYTIHVNGRLLRMGIEIDTALSSPEYVDAFDLSPDECYYLAAGNRKLLLLTGGIDKCNGTGCGVSFYIVYDLVKHKGFLLQQFRSDFVAGIDRRTGDLIFFNMDDRHDYNYLYQGFFESGKAFVFDRQNRISPYRDSLGVQYHFNAFCGGESDSLRLLSGNLPLKKYGQ